MLFCIYKVYSRLQGRDIMKWLLLDRMSISVILAASFSIYT